MTDPPLDLEELKRLVTKNTPVRTSLVNISNGHGEYHFKGDRDDATIIVAAVNSLPALIVIAEEVERLKSDNEILEARIENLEYPTMERDR